MDYTSVASPRMSEERTERRGEIREAMERLEKNIASVNEAVDRLGAKITPVLSPAGPQAVLKPDEKPRGCDLANHIEQMVVRTNHISALVSALTDRCEL